MAFAYCLFHKRFMDINEVKIKKCRCKANTKKPCRYFVLTAKQKYIRGGVNNDKIRKHQFRQR